MNRAPISIFLLALITVLSNPAAASADLSFESQLLQGHKDIVSMAASAPISAALAPEKVLTDVGMLITWSYEQLMIADDDLKIYIFADHIFDNNVTNFSRGLKATATPIYLQYPSRGYYIQGRGVHFKIEREVGGSWEYAITGTSRKPEADSNGPEQLRLNLEPTNFGWNISTNDMSLNIQYYMHLGARITGWIDREKVSKTTLGIIGACVATIVNPRIH